MGFYNQLFWVIKSKQLTTESVCNKLGLSRSFLSVMKSRGSVPKIDTCEKLYRVCGYTLCAVPNDMIHDEFIVIDTTSDKQ